MNTKLHMILFASHIFAADALAQWECKRPDNSFYEVSQRPMRENCRPIGSPEDAPFESLKPALPPKPFKSNPKEAKATMAAGKAAIIRDLKDPDSAKFRGLFVKRDIWLCGEINARNSYGGYTGFKRFVSMGATGITRIDDGGEEFLVYWASACSDLSQDEIRQAISR